MLNIITLAIILSSSAAAQDNTITIKAVVPEKVTPTPEEQDRIQREQAEQIRKNHERMRANAIGPVEFEALGKSCCESVDGIWLGYPKEIPEDRDWNPALDNPNLTCVLPWLPAFSARTKGWPDHMKEELVPKLDKYMSCVGRGYLTYQDGGQGETKYYYYTSLAFLNLVKHGGTSAANLQQAQYTWDACP
jgi:hypothetical protein